MRLEGVDPHRRPRRRTAFNTSKVRLEGGSTRPQPERELLSIPQRCDWKLLVGDDFVVFPNFQYLKGAIGSGRQQERQTGGHPFQYLKGAIGSLQLGARHLDADRFQYLKGAIGSSSRASWSVISRSLSIPQRCDWKRRRRGLPAGLSSAFNTSKVRLEVRCESLG